MLIDITRTIGKDTLVYPGDSVHLLKREAAYDTGDDYSLTQLMMSAHTGTHIDAPEHFIPGGKRIDELPLERFILKTCVMKVSGVKRIEEKHLSKSDLTNVESILFKTDNSLLDRDQFHEDHVDLSVDAANYLIEASIKLVGIDYLSIERAGDDSCPVHQMLLGNDVLILEDIDLINVEEGSYRLMCFPLRLYQTEASPVRAVLETI